MQHTKPDALDRAFSTSNLAAFSESSKYVFRRWLGSILSIIPNDDAKEIACSGLPSLMSLSTNAVFKMEILDQ